MNVSAVVFVLATTAPVLASKIRAVYDSASPTGSHVSTTGPLGNKSPGGVSEPGLVFAGVGGITESDATPISAIQPSTPVSKFTNIQFRMKPLSVRTTGPSVTSP